MYHFFKGKLELLVLGVPSWWKWTATAVFQAPPVSTETKKTKTLFRFEKNPRTWHHPGGFAFKRPFPFIFWGMLTGREGVHRKNHQRCPFFCHQRMMPLLPFLGGGNPDVFFLKLTTKISAEKEEKLPMEFKNCREKTIMHFLCHRLLKRTVCQKCWQTNEIKFNEFNDGNWINTGPNVVFQEDEEYQNKPSSRCCVEPNMKKINLPTKHRRLHSPIAPNQIPSIHYGNPPGNLVFLHQRAACGFSKSNITGGTRWLYLGMRKPFTVTLHDRRKLHWDDRNFSQIMILVMTGILGVTVTHIPNYSTRVWSINSLYWGWSSHLS